MVATHQQCHRAVGSFHNQGFNGLIGADLEKGGNVVDGFNPRRGHGLHRLGGGGTWCGGCNGFGQLDIGSVVGVRAISEEVFTRLGQHMEFMRARAADSARVSGHRPKSQSQSGEYPRIRVEHRLVGGSEAFLAGVEGIRVLHQKFARPHDAEARANFVAEFHLDLIEVDR